MKKICILLVLICNFVFADYDDTFKEFMKASKQDEVIKKTIDNDNINNVLETQLAMSGVDISKSDKEHLVSIVKKFMTNMIDSINDDILEIYKQYFAESDLKELVEFYKTPLGEKIANANVNIQADMQNILLKNFAKYMPEMEEEIKKAFSK